MATIDEGTSVEWLVTEHVNIEAALGCAIETGDISTGLPLATAVGWFWHCHGRLVEPGNVIVCIATVGGSGVGGHLLRRVIAGFPEAKARVPGLRMIVVAGPRIDPASLPTHDGLEIRPYVPELYRHLAACDLAVVQGGLTTTMELTAGQRPCTSRSATTSSRTSTSATGSTATAPDGAWTTRPPSLPTSPRRSPVRSAARSIPSSGIPSSRSDRGNCKLRARRSSAAAGS